MAFDSDLRTLLKSIAKVSRKPFQDIGAQTQETGLDESAHAKPAATQPMTMDAEKVAGKV